MTAEIAGTVYLLLPLAGGALVHGLCLRQGWLALLARPIDGDRKLRGRPLFGHSKTWRGPVAVAAGAGAVYALQRHVLHAVPPVAALELVDYGAMPGAWFGALAGFVAELFELPNSFVKRRLDIAPGGTARGGRGAVFFLWDQLDVLVGFWLVFAFAVAPNPLRLAVSAVATAVLHPLLSVVGYLLGMRRTAR